MQDLSAQQQDTMRNGRTQCTKARVHAGCSRRLSQRAIPIYLRFAVTNGVGDGVQLPIGVADADGVQVYECQGTDATA